MARGSVWKVCTHDGKERRTGLPAWGKRRAVPACRLQHGHWVWRAYAGRDPDTGAPVQPSRSGFATKELAEADLAAYLAEAGPGRRVHRNRKMTIAELLGLWLEHLERRVRDGDLEPTSYRNYEVDVRVHIIPALGGGVARDLRLPQVSQWMADLGARTEVGPRRLAPSSIPKRQLAAVRAIHDGVEPTPLIRRRLIAAGFMSDAGQLTTTGQDLLCSGNVGAVVQQRSRAAVSKARRTLRAALTWAIEQDLVDANAAAGRITITGRRPVDDDECWQPDELAAFFAHIETDPDVALWMIAGFTGLRRSELLGLPWSAVDLVSAEPGVWVRQKVVELPGPQPCPYCKDGHKGRVLRGVLEGEQGTKSAAGRRWAPIPPDAVGLFLAHQLEQEQHKERLGKAYVDHGLVFAGPLGEPRRPDSVTRRFQALAREAGVPESRFHGIRHATASLYGAVDLTMDTVGLLLGHASKAVTRLYTHSVRSTMSEASERVQRLVKDAGARPKP
jgi:integrase